jgi:hypothetical protein
MISSARDDIFILEICSAIVNRSLLSHEQKSTAKGKISLALGIIESLSRKTAGGQIIQRFFSFPERLTIQKANSFSS